MLRLVVVAVVGLAFSGGLPGGPLPYRAVPGAGEVAGKLQLALISAACHAVAEAEVRLPQEAGSVEPPEPLHARVDRAAPHVWALRTALRSHRVLSDQRPAIRLTYRGTQVPHSSDEPPERPRS